MGCGCRVVRPNCATSSRSERPIRMRCAIGWGRTARSDAVRVVVWALSVVVPPPDRPPGGMATERFWNASEPGQRTWIGRRVRCEAPVDDGGHIVCGSEIPSAGDCQQVAERVFIGFGRDGE